MEELAIFEMQKSLEAIKKLDDAKDLSRKRERIIILSEQFAQFRKEHREFYSPSTEYDAKLLGSRIVYEYKRIYDLDMMM